MRAAAARLGWASTVEILREAGYEEPEIQAMLGVTRQAPSAS